MAAQDSLVSPEMRARIRGGAEPIARAVGRVGITPNGLTVLGFLISAIAAGLAAAQLWLPASLVMVFGAAFDMLDGALARATGRTSRFGAFLDSTMDRWGEAVLYAGITAGALLGAAPLTAILATAAMSAAFMVSYTRAKAESMGFTGEVGVAPRPERVVILAVGLFGAGLSGGPLFGPWLQAALAVVFILSTITTLQRIFHVRAQARTTEVND